MDFSGPVIICLAGSQAQPGLKRMTEARAKWLVARWFWWDQMPLKVYIQESERVTKESEDHDISDSPWLKT